MPRAARARSLMYASVRSSARQLQRWRASSRRALNQRKIRVHL